MATQSELEAKRNDLLNEAKRLKREERAFSFASKLISLGLRIREVDREIESLAREESYGR